MIERLRGCVWIGWLLAWSCSAWGMTTTEAISIVLNSKNATGAKTFATAQKMVERAAAQGKPLQQFVVGVTTDDKELAKKYLGASREMIRAAASEKDNALAWYLLSLESNNIKQLRRAADGGNVQAQNALGTILTQNVLSQSNVSTNQVEAALRESFVLFSKASAQYDPNAFINLGTCYLRGFGCKRDLEMAFTCFKAAAEAGHPEGMDNVSACYQFGHGVKKNRELCLLWAMRGRAARGDEAAAQWLKDRK